MEKTWFIEITVLEPRSLWIKSVSGHLESMATSVRPSIWQAGEITLEGSIRFGTSLIHRNVIIKLRNVPHPYNGFRPQVSLDQIRFRTFGADLATSVGPSGSLVGTITLEESMPFGPNMVHRIIIFKLRSSSEMGNIESLLLVPSPQEVEVFKEIILQHRERKDYPILLQLCKS